MARAILNFFPEGFKRTKGNILYKGKSVFEMDKDSLLEIRGKRMYYLNQDPFVSFDPTYKIRFQLKEYLKSKGIEYKEDQVINVLKKLGFGDPKKILNLYPFELSGGMLQRVSIARALLIKSEVLIADEITTALDEKLQKDLIRLIEEIITSENLSVILITHNLPLLNFLNYSNVIVLYGGELIEENRDILKNPLHPYTSSLLNSDPELWQKKGKITYIKGFLPLSRDELRGCVFYNRCELATPECQEKKPPLINIINKGRVKCFSYLENDSVK